MDAVANPPALSRAKPLSKSRHHSGVEDIIAGWRAASDGPFAPIDVLSRHPDVVKRLSLIWIMFESSLDKFPRTSISSVEFLPFHARLCAALFPDIVPSQARSLGLADLSSATDNLRSNHVEQRSFFQFVVAVAVAWLPGQATPDAIVRWLDDVTNRIAFRHSDLLFMRSLQAVHCLDAYSHLKPYDRFFSSCRSLVEAGQVATKKDRTVSGESMRKMSITVTEIPDYSSTGTATGEVAGPGAPMPRPTQKGRRWRRLRQWLGTRLLGDARSRQESTSTSHLLAPPRATAGGIGISDDTSISSLSSGESNVDEVKVPVHLPVPVVVPRAVSIPANISSDTNPSDAPIVSWGKAASIAVAAVVRGRQRLERLLSRTGSSVQRRPRGNSLPTMSAPAMAAAQRAMSLPPVVIAGQMGISQMIRSGSVDHALSTDDSSNDDDTASSVEARRRIKDRLLRMKRRRSVPREWPQVQHDASLFGKSNVFPPHQRVASEISSNSDLSPPE